MNYAKPSLLCANFKQLDNTWALSVFTMGHAEKALSHNQSVGS